jgi:hypothetical protein
MSLTINVPRIHAGVEHNTLTGVKRVRVPMWSSEDFSSMELPGPQITGSMIGINSQASEQIVDPPIHVTFEAIPFADDVSRKWVDELSADTLMFTALNFPPDPMTIRDARRVAMVPMPMVNYIMHANTLAGEEDISPEYLVKKWYLAGTMLSQRDHPIAPHNDVERTVALITTSRVNVDNVWNEEITVNDSLYLIAKKVEVTPETRYVLDLDGMTVQQPGVRGTRGLVTMVAQLVPCVVKDRFGVPAKDLIYYENCKPVLGIPIYVGRVVYNEFYKRGDKPMPSCTDIRVNDSPCRNLRRLKACRPVLVHLNVAY